ncbi:MAG: TrkA family potassium uptake protein [Armatimonadota bacterium]|nr:MAG: TrkA family potassium uptake protein [Armatimonadota bacterium]
MKILILGCGRVGSALATLMSRENHEVTILDRDSNAFRRLGSDFGGQRVVGNGIDEDILRRAGVQNADAFVSVTNGDNTNIMAAQIAKEKFGVPRVMARIYDPIRAEEYGKMGMATFCSTAVGAGIVRDLITEQPVRSYEEYARLTSELGR